MNYTHKMDEYENNYAELKKPDKEFILYKSISRKF